MKLWIADLGRMDYPEALEIQEELLELRLTGRGEDVLLLVEHPPVLTLGRRGQYSNILLPESQLKAQGIQIYEVNRGGDVTYHGPGQIVGYPIFNLSRHDQDIKAFVRRLEDIFIRLLNEKFQITAHRDEQKYTGVWVGDAKITAIGIAVKHWVTMHGFAFNVNTRLDDFRWINPCGITDKGVTSLEKLMGRTLDFDEVKRWVADYICEVFGMDQEVLSLNDLKVILNHKK